MSKNNPFQGRSNHLRPIGLMIFVCRRLPENEKIYISAFSAPVVDALWLIIVNFHFFWMAFSAE